jgi:hypothetical protein
MTSGHPVILYPTDGSAQQHLAEAIATAAAAGASNGAGRALLNVSRREQARLTSELYLAARADAERARFA